MRNIINASKMTFVNQTSQENEGMFTAKDVMPGKNFTALEAAKLRKIN